MEAVHTIPYGSTASRGVASLILWYLAFRYRVGGSGDVPPDAPKPAMIPSAIVRAPSTSRVTITSYSR
ncbi:MAG: hypothetical protein ACO2O2_13590 [Acidilobaceae archaeon]